MRPPVHTTPITTLPAPDPATIPLPDAPRPVVGRLPNGVRWVTTTTPNHATVSFQVLVRAGSRYEPAQYTGLAHVVEHLCFTGTPEYTALELTRLLSIYGAEINAYTNSEMAVYHCKVVPEYLAATLRLYGQMLFETMITAETLATEKEVVLREVGQRLGHPMGYLSMVLLPQYAWEGTADARPVGGTPPEIAGVTPQVVQRFMAEYYTPANVVIAVSGAVPADIVALLEDAFGGYTVHPCFWQLPGEERARIRQGLANRSHADTGEWTEEIPRSPPQHACHHPQPMAVIQQAHTREYTFPLSGGDAIIALSFPYDTAQYKTAAALLSYLLLETMGARLLANLRMQRGLVYEVTPLSVILSEVALFGFSFQVANDDAVIDEAIDATLHELHRLRHEPVALDELRHAQQALAARARLHLEDSMTLAAYYGPQLMHGQPLRLYPEETMEILQFTPAGLQCAALTLFAPSRLNIAVMREERP